MECLHAGDVNGQLVSPFRELQRVLPVGVARRVDARSVLDVPCLHTSAGEGCTLQIGDAAGDHALCREGEYMSLNAHDESDGDGGGVTVERTSDHASDMFNYC